MARPDVIERLRELAGDIGPAVDSATLLASPAAAFPVGHLELLGQLNGFTVGGGAFRLFGVRSEAHLDIALWNAPETWRFAWDERVDPFVIFGETAWGEEYAYRRAGRPGELAPEVYVLESAQLGPQVIAASFDDFVARSLLKDAERPADPYTVAALRRWGPVPAGRHWVFSPPLVLGAPDTIENVMQMPAAAAMVVAGDLALALESHLDQAVTAVVPWTDERGRSRLRVEFAR